MRNLDVKDALGGGSYRGVYADFLSGTVKIFKLNLPCDLGEQSVIASQPYIRAGMKLGPPLTHKDLARFNNLAAKPFDAEPFPYAIPAVGSASLSFFVCHEITLL